MRVRFPPSFLIICLIFVFFAACSKSFRLQTYTIGIDPTWAPLELQGANAHVLGYSIELLQEIANEEKFKVGIIKTNYGELLTDLKRGKYDAALSSITPFDFLKTEYDFSEIYLRTGPVLVVPISSSIKSMSMLNGKEIAVDSESKDYEIVNESKGVIPRSYDSVSDVLLNLTKGTYDGALVPALIAKAYVRDIYYDQLKIVTEPLNDEGIRLITLHDKNRELIRLFNHGLIQLEEEGSVKKLQHKWSLTQNIRHLSCSLYS